MAIEITKYMELTGLTEGAAKGALSRGDEYASWAIPAGAAKLVAKDAMETELEADETNAGTIVVEPETEPTGDDTTGDDTTGDAGAGEGEDEGDGADLD